MERIELEDQRSAGYPVVKRTALNQRFNGAVLKAESRDRLKRGDDGTMTPIVKPNGKHAQEMVVTCLTLPGTTSPVGLGEDEEHVPEPGDIVRLILKGKAFGDWIEQKRDLPNRVVAVGDVVSQTTTLAQAYDAQGNATGGEITTQSEVDTLRARGRTVGIYGPLTINPPTSDEWQAKAVAAYRSLQQPIPAESSFTGGDFASLLPSNDVDAPEPKRPDQITEEALAQMDPATRKQLADIPF
jgi:hypothetical protein